MQIAYTSIFGAYSSFLLLRIGLFCEIYFSNKIGNFLAPFLAHSFCNYMGLPMPNLFRHPKGKSMFYSVFIFIIKVIGAGYVIGLLLFGLFLFPATDPEMHGSIFYNPNHFLQY